MSISQSLRNSAVVVEKYVTLGATSGTTVGPTVPAGTIVVYAGFENFTAVPDVTTYTVAVGIAGNTPILTASSYDNAAAGTIKQGHGWQHTSGERTVDATTVIDGDPGPIEGRIWAVVIDVNGSVGKAATADRDILG